MSATSSIETSPGLDIRQTSAEVFQTIKPICVELSQLALLPKNAFRPDSPKLISTIRSLNDSLQALRAAYTNNGKLFVISPNLADYVFFPLSNLLQQSALDDKVIEQLLCIIAFLVNSAWIPNDKFDEILVDQLYPVIIHLIETNNVELVKAKPFEFRAAAYTVIDSVLRGVDPAYFATQEPRKLSLLGDTVTILLALPIPLNRPAPEEIQFTTDVLALHSFLFNKMVTAEQLSYIFPGIISSYVNFVTESRNLHHHILVHIIGTIRDVITKVFDDKTLGITVDVEDTSIEGLALEAKQKSVNQLENVHIALQSTSKDRNVSWLKAMSKQLKISLTIFFKAILLPDSYKSKIKNKPRLVEAIQAFVREIHAKCFWSLLNELFSFNIDVLVLVVAAQGYAELHTNHESEETSLIKSTISSILADAVPEDYIMREEASVKILDRKVQDLIETKVPIILMSASDEKIYNLIVAIKFHMVYLQSISNTTSNFKSLKQHLVRTLKGSLFDAANVLASGNTEKNPILPNSAPSSSSETESNKLDNIELPPYVNASSISAIKDHRSTHTTARSHSTELQILANEWSVTTFEETEERHVFSDVFSHKTEDQLGSLLSFLANDDSSPTQQLTTLESIFMQSETHSESIQEQSLALWLANNYVTGLAPVNNPKIDEFLLTEELNSLDLDMDDDPSEEINYLLLNEAQDLMEQVSPKIEDSLSLVLSKAQKKEKLLNERAYCLALECFGTLSNRLGKKEFQEIVLMGNLYAILEALTFNFNPMVQQHAKTAVLSIANNYYNGSIVELIMDNSNYLVESLSMVLSVPGDLTPAVSGILLIVLKISGTRLLLENQLNDILQQLFILLDAYHGYSVLVEGFFVVFKELVSQIESEYLKMETSLIKQKDSAYKPWGISARTEMLDLISDSNKIINPLEDFDAGKEYFTRPKDAPFEEIDSDDEEISEPKQDDDDVKWTSNVPQSIYMLVQKIFLYGFKLLPHPSSSLKIQILKTMVQNVLILSTNYKLLLPILSQNWHVILALLDEADDNVAIGTLELMKSIIQIDGEKNETFMSSKFIDAWSKLNQARMIKKNGPGSAKAVAASHPWRNHDPRLLELVAAFLVEGLRTYERIVPDVTAIHMMELVLQIGGVQKYELPRGLQNIVWVLKKW